MKTIQTGSSTFIATIILINILGPTSSNAVGQLNIRADAKHNWAENIGWFNWHDADSGASGILVGSTFLTGFIWAENVGWILAGDGAPDDGTHYANTDGSDFGVNIDPVTGNLFGFAWGENVGWINFDTASLGAHAARIDLCTRRFHGFAWGENIGWINLDDDEHFVASVLVADCNGNALEDACDADADGDDQIDDCDNCPNEPNVDQADFDHDGAGDVCDPDIDNDTVANGPDVCDYSVLGSVIVLDTLDPRIGTVPYGDLDGDCDVDLDDHALMQTVFTGPNGVNTLVDERAECIPGN